MTSTIIKTTLIGLAAMIALALGWVAYRSSVPIQSAQQQASLPAEKSDRDKADAAAPATPDAAKPEAGKPAAAQPEAGGAPERASFDIVRVEPSGEAVVAGRAAPGATVELLRNGEVVARETANAAGEFVITPPPLPAGDHQLQLRTAGPDETMSERTVVVSIPKDRQGEVLVVASEPNKPAEILQRPSAAGPQGADVATADPSAPAAPAPGSTQAAPAPAKAADTPLRVGAVETEGGRLFVQGTGPAGTKLRIHLNEAPVAEATVGPEGNWSLTIEKGLTPGDYRVRADQVDGSGAVTSRAEVPFEYTPDTALAAAPMAPADTSAPPSASPAPSEAQSQPAAPSSAPAASGQAPASASTPASPDTAAANPVVAGIGTVAVKRGDSLWRISRNLYGQGQRYSVIYDANTAQIRDPDLIYPDQIFVVPDQPN